MPLIPIAVAGALGFGVGFTAGDGVDGFSRGVKWAVIGAGGYLAWRHRRAIAGAFT